MKIRSIPRALLALLLLPLSLPADSANTLTPDEISDGWISLFDGESLTHWRASDLPGSFRVEDGVIVAEGPRSHLYYVGTIPGGELTNFEFSAEVQTFPGANSGIYFHTRWQDSGWPDIGYEVQINNSDPPGSGAVNSAARTGSLWGIVNIPEAAVPDQEWFTLLVRVQGKQVVTEINGRVIVDYTEPAKPERTANLAGKILSKGTIALQASDPNSRTLFRSLKVRRLSDDPGPDSTSPPESSGEVLFNRDAVLGRKFRMGWQMDGHRGVITAVTMRADGTVNGAPSENEALWGLDDSGALVLSGRKGGNSVTFSEKTYRDGRWFLSGESLITRGATIFLEEVPELPAVLDDDTLNRIIRPWSKQQIVSLNPGESYRFKLSDGTEKEIRLGDVREERDTVIKLVRRAEVELEIDGQPLELVCAPYVMPTEMNGIRVQADITSGMLPELPKKVSLSIWDARDPVVDTEEFVFPLADYRLFSHSLQAYNEVVWLGVNDGDPQGVTARHSYGIDIAAFEDAVDVLAVADGVVLDLYPDTRNPYAALIESKNGVVWEYGHMNSVQSEVREGSAVHKGQIIGKVGKRGYSGNFSHLHLGLHPSRGHRAAVIRTQRLNFFPWILTAYRARYPQALFALAGTHQVIRTGETCSFDASHSLAFDGSAVSYRWQFHDGETVEQVRAQKAYHKPGVYIAELWIEDDKGRRDVDFCRIKVFPGNSSVSGIPTLFMTHSPTTGITPGQPVNFRCWLQAEKDAPILLDFGDGSPPQDYTSYSEVKHAFEKPGVYVISANTTASGMPITQKQKVLVTDDGKFDFSIASKNTEKPVMEEATGTAGDSGSSVGTITVGAGRNPDGTLINPGRPLPVDLDAISADIEFINHPLGERVRTWIEQGDNHTVPIDGVITGEGSGTIPFEMNLADAVFPSGRYALVVMLGEGKRFKQGFDIGEPEFQSITHSDYLVRFEIPAHWEEKANAGEFLLSPKEGNPDRGAVWGRIRAIPNGPQEAEKEVAAALGELFQTLPGATIDEIIPMIVRSNGEAIMDPDEVKVAENRRDPLRLNRVIKLHFIDPATGANWRGFIVSSHQINDEARFHYLYSMACGEDRWAEFESAFVRLLETECGVTP